MGQKSKIFAEISPKQPFSGKIDAETFRLSIQFNVKISELHKNFKICFIFLFRSSHFMPTHLSCLVFSPQTFEMFLVL